jgi:hypothetical protein
VKEKIVLYDKKESPALMDAALLKNWMIFNIR